jgi:uncharacterized protein
LAMREKDKDRLVVLRAVIAATANAAKLDSPIKNDAAMVELLRKHVRLCAEARDEFAAAGRDDLVAKEDAQIAVLNEYVASSGLEELGEAQLEKIVKGVMAGMGEAPKMTQVMKVMVTPGGPLDNKLYQGKDLAHVVEMMTRRERKKVRVEAYGTGTHPV